MAVVIRLARRGKKKQPHYNIVVQEREDHPKRGYIEKLGYYVPQRNPATLELDIVRTAHWINNGAKPTVRVAKLIEVAKSGGPQLKEKKNKKFAGKFEKAPAAVVAPEVKEAVSDEPTAVNPEPVEAVAVETPEPAPTAKPDAE